MKFNEVLNKGFMLLLVLSGGGMPFLFERNMMSIALFLFIVFLILFYKSKIAKPVFQGAVGLTFFSILLLVVTYVFSDGKQVLLKYGFHLLTFVISILTLVHFLINRKKEAFIEDLYSVLKLIMFHAILSFFAYFFVSGSLEVIKNPLTNYECLTFKKIFFYMPERNEYSFFGLTNCRAQGLFWEPGVLQIFLNFFLFLELFVFKKSKWVTALAVFAVLTTQSTTGLVLLCVLMIAYFWNSIKKNILLIPIAALLLTPIYYMSKSNVEEKVVGERSTSFAIRYFDLTDGFLLALDYPLTGMGLDDARYKEIRSESYSSTEGVENTEKGNSNSIIYLMAAVGIPFTVFIIYALFKQTVIRKRRGLFMLFFIVSILTEPVLLKPFFMLFVMSGMIVIFKNSTQIQLSNS